MVAIIHSPVFVQRPISALADAGGLQQREWTGWQRAVGWVDNADRRKRKRTSTRRGIILAVAALLLIGVPLLLAVSLWPSLGINLSIFGGAGGDVTPATPAQWARDTQLTPYNTNDPAFASQQSPVPAAFPSYYTPPHAPPQPPPRQSPAESPLGAPPQPLAPARAHAHARTGYANRNKMRSENGDRRRPSSLRRKCA